MKIAFLISSLSEMGPTLVVKHLIDQLVAHGHQCKYYYFDDVKQLSVACPTQQIGFWRAIDFNRYDVVHAHGLRPNAYIALHRQTKHKALFVTTLHSYSFIEFRLGFKPPLHWAISRLFIMATRRFDKIVTLSKDAIQYYSKYLPAHKLSYAYNGVAIDKHLGLTVNEQQLVKQFKQNDKLIAISGGLVWLKRIDLAIRALTFLPQNYKLIVFGEGGMRQQLQQLACSLGVENRVLLAGYHLKAYRFLPYIDVYIQTSMSEGFCLALTEAALYGKKIVSSDVPSMREKYSDNEILYFNLPDAQQLAEQILAADANQQLGEMAQSKAQWWFTPQKMYEAYMDIYQQK